MHVHVTYDAYGSNWVMLKYDILDVVNIECNNFTEITKFEKYFRSLSIIVMIISCIVIFSANDYHGCIIEIIIIYVQPFSCGAIVSTVLLELLSSVQLFHMI